MKILHYTEQEGLGEDELPWTIAENKWDQPVVGSAWRKGQESEQFPTLEDVDEHLPSGITRALIVGGKSGIRFPLINDVKLEDGTTDQKTVWVYVFRNENDAARTLEKSQRPQKIPAKKEKLPWKDPNPNEAA